MPGAMAGRAARGPTAARGRAAQHGHCVREPRAPSALTTGETLLFDAGTEVVRSHPARFARGWRFPSVYWLFVGTRDLVLFLGQMHTRRSAQTAAQQQRKKG